MKKIISLILPAVGIIACLWLIVTVLRFGSCNMARAENSASYWRFSGEFR